MRKDRAIVLNPNGMHLRMASRVVKTKKHFDVDVVIAKGDERADGDSILQLLSLNAQQGCEIEISVDGDRADEALKALRELFSDGGGI